MALTRRGARRLPQLGNAPPPDSNKPGVPQTAVQQAQRPALYSGVWLELKELFRRIWILENNGGGGAGTVTSITATSPIVATPSPIVTAGVISHAASGVTPATYGDASNYAIVTVDAKGHVTAASSAAKGGGGGGGGSTSPLTTKGDIWGYDTADNRIPVGANDNPLVADSTAALGVAYKTLPVAGGGTGDTTLTAHGVLVGEGTSAVAVTAVGATGQFLGGNTGADPTWQSLPAQGVLQTQEFSVAGTTNWTVPTGVSGAWVTMVGAGGGGSTTIAAALGGGGGGSGELVQNLQCSVPSGGTVSITVGGKGLGGAAGQASAQVGTDGGTSSFGVFNARGGKGGTVLGAGGAGAGVIGAIGAGGAAGAPGTAGTRGSVEGPCFFAGGGGAGGGNSTVANGGAGAGNGGYSGGSAGTAASSQAGGGGGASVIWGAGGAGGNGGSIGNSATSGLPSAGGTPGAGGGGGGGKVTTTIGGGNGADGYVLVMWVA